MPAKQKFDSPDVAWNAENIGINFMMIAGRFVAQGIYSSISTSFGRVWSMQADKEWTDNMMGKDHVIRRSLNVIKENLFTLWHAEW